MWEVGMVGKEDGTGVATSVDVKHDGVIVAPEGEVEHIGLDVCQACNLRVSPYFEPATGEDRDGNTAHEGNGSAKDGKRGIKRMVRKCPKCHSVIGVTGGKPAPKPEQFAAPLIGMVAPLASNPQPALPIRPMVPELLPVDELNKRTMVAYLDSCKPVTFEQQAATELAATEAQLAQLKSRAKALRKILGR